MAYTVTNNPWSSQYSVGIGTDSPTHSLNVIGDIGVGGWTGTDDRKVGKPNGAGWGDGSAYIKFADLSTGSFGDVRKGTNIDIFTHKHSGGTNHLATFSANGKVGILTDSPGAKLHVGNFSLNATGDVSKVGVFGDTVTGNAYPLTVTNYATQTNGDTARLSFNFGNGNWSATAFVGGVIESASTAETGLALGTYGNDLTEKVRITGYGDVGIGTTSPGDYNANAHKLVVYDATVPGMTLAGGANNVGRIFFADGTSGNAEWEGYIDYNHSTNAMSFGTSHAEAVRIDSAGKVGIGTASPSAKLDVAGDVAFSKGSRTTLYPTTTNQALHMKSNGTGALQFNNDSAGDIDMVVGGGNVGIGTSSPAQTLHVAGGNLSTIRNNMLGMTSNTVGAGAETNIYHNAYYDTSDNREEYLVGDEACRLQFINGTTNFFQAAAGATDGAITWIPSIAIKADGNVGIGDSSPSYKLEVAGTFYASGSSQAFKKDVTDLAIDSSAIYNLNPKSYNYKKDYEDFGYDLAEGKQFGLISEEVAEAVPELAIMKDGEPKNVDYQKLSVLLLAEMQKMNKRIEDLECHI